MSRRKPDIKLGSVLALVAMNPERGGVAIDVLDAAERLLRQHGLKRWSMDDVADTAGLGRTTVYRAFANRDDLVHAVLARELRTTLEAVVEAAAEHDALEDKAAAAVVAALRALRGSTVDRLLEIDPPTFLPFLTTEASVLLDLARPVLAAQIRAYDPSVEPDVADVTAEAMARLGLSFVVTRRTVVPLDDPAAAGELLRRAVRPILAGLGSPPTR